MLWFSLSIFAQKITIKDPSNTQNIGNTLNSNLIGTNRNHTEQQGWPSGVGSGQEAMLDEKIKKYGDISPRFGEKKKIFRFGHTPIDGEAGVPAPKKVGNTNTYTLVAGEGFHWEYDYSSMVVDGVVWNGKYPYDNWGNFFSDANTLDAQVCIGINVGTGTPKEAASFVQAIKDAGHLNKVKFFELGNELSGVWVSGHYTKSENPTEYCDTVLPFITAMKAIDSSIKIALMGSYNYTFDWDGDSPETGIAAIEKYLEFQDQHSDFLFDFVAMHGYSSAYIFGDWATGACRTYDENNNPTPFDLTLPEMANNYLAVNAWALENSPFEIHELLKSRGISIVNTEYATMAGNINFIPIIHSITEAMYTTDEIITSIKMDVQAAINFSLIHAHYNDKPELSDNLFFPPVDYNTPIELRKIRETPTFKVHKMLAEALGQKELYSLEDDFISKNLVLCNGESFSYNPIRHIATVDDDGTIRVLIMNQTDTDQNVDFDIETNESYCTVFKTIRGEDPYSKFETITEESERDVDIDAVNVKAYSINMLILKPEGTTGDDFTLELKEGETNGKTIIWENDLDVPRDFFGKLTVKEGINLIIKEDVTLSFATAGQLLIEPGARVELHGTLTSCTSWEGVRVVGTDSDQQLLQNGMCKSQGVIFTQDALIENADVGILTVPVIPIRNNTQWYHQAGSIIQCENTDFINNSEAIKLWHYLYFVDNISYFDNCEFIVNDNMQSDFKNFVVVYFNGGIDFINCKFNNNLSYSNYLNAGILAYNAGIKISGELTEFNNLFYGLDARKVWGINLPFSVTNATFNRCVFGIHNGGFSGVNISENTFYMGDLNDYYGSNPSQYGVHSEGVINGIGISGNQFEKNENGNAETTGTYTIDIGDGPNVISSNEYKGLDIGNAAFGFNATFNEGLVAVGAHGWGIVENESVKKGLLYLCNTNYANFPNDYFDFLAGGGGEDYTEWPINKLHGIKYGEYQDDIGSVHNIFCYNDNSAHSDFTVLASDLVDYYYDPTMAGEQPIDYGGLELHANNEGKDCSQLAHVGGKTDPVLKADYQQYADAYDLAYADFETAVSTRNESDMAKYNHALNYYKEQKEQIALAGLKNAYANHSTDIEINAWLTKIDNLAADMTLVGNYIAQGENTVALGLLDGLVEKYHLSEQRALDVQNVKSIYQALSTQDIHDLDEVLVANMRSWADAKQGFACYLSRNILNFRGAHYPPVVFELPQNNLPFGKIIKKQEVDLEDKTRLKFYPNPAKDKLEFELVNPLENTKYQVKLVNIQGVIQEVLIFDTKDAILDYDTKVQKGIYFVELYKNGVLISTEKLIITK